MQEPSLVKPGTIEIGVVEFIAVRRVGFAKLWAAAAIAAALTD